LVGWGVPLLHYKKVGGGARLRGAGEQPTFEWSLVPSGNGLGVVGVF
jgi:hypothetical protein